MKRLFFVFLTMMMALALSASVQAQERMYSVAEFVNEVHEPGIDVTVYGYARVHPLQSSVDYIRSQLGYQNQRRFLYSFFGAPDGSVVNDPFFSLESLREIETGKFIVIKGTTSRQGKGAWKLVGVKVKGWAKVGRQ